MVLVFRSPHTKLVNDVRMRDRFSTLKDWKTGVWISPGALVVIIDQTAVSE